MAEKQPTQARSEQRLARRGGYGQVTSPFTALQRMADEFDRMLFGDLGLGRRWGMPMGGAGRETTPAMWMPDVDMFQRDNDLVIRADLPGMNPDDVTVEITENAVVLEGERRQEQEEEREGMYRRERIYGRFSRVIPLPEGAIADQAKASFRNGVLEITMPAPPASTSRGRRLEIEGATRGSEGEARRS